MKGFCASPDSYSGVYGAHFERCRACPENEYTCLSYWAYSSNCLQECFGYEGSGCEGSECQSYSMHGPYAPGSIPDDDQSDPGYDEIGSEPQDYFSPQSYTAEETFSFYAEEEYHHFNRPKKCYIDQKYYHVPRFDVGSESKLRCGRLPKTPRSKTPHECAQECADERHCQYAIWHSGKYINDNEPDLPKPWSRTEYSAGDSTESSTYTRAVCYMYSFASESECEWDGFKGRDHPNFGKFLNSIVKNLPHPNDRHGSSWQDDLEAGPDYVYEYEENGEFEMALMHGLDPDPAAACKPGYELIVPNYGDDDESWSWSESHGYGPESDSGSETGFYSSNGSDNDDSVERREDNFYDDYGDEIEQLGRSKDRLFR